MLLVLANISGKTRPLYLKRVSQAIATSLIRSYRQVGDRTDKWAIEPTSGRSSRQSVDRTDRRSESKETRKVL
ncbi:hypothetical protein Q5691_25675 [Microcoleus sp. w1-18aA5]|uniref:hypothetical protein n=1 Tax=Microcoleus sp. w1-18aA5 TaxID=2818982 RepID=UPI002FD2C80E